MEEDVRTCTNMLRQRYPGVPICLLGFSLGSFAVRCLLRCVVERITYQNAENGFSVIKCRAKGYTDLVTVVV